MLTQVEAKFRVGKITISLRIETCQYLIFTADTREISIRMLEFVFFMH